MIEKILEIMSYLFILGIAIFSKNDRWFRFIVLVILLFIAFSCDYAVRILKGSL